MVAQNSVTRAWLTTEVMSRKRARPTNTPSTERHQTYDSPRRICGYVAPSGGSAARSTSKGAAFDGDDFDGLRLSVGCGFARGSGSALPVRTAGLPDLLRILELVAIRDSRLLLLGHDFSASVLLLRCRPDRDSIRQSPAHPVRRALPRSVRAWTLGQAARWTRRAAVKFGCP